MHILIASSGCEECPDAVEVAKAIAGGRGSMLDLHSRRTVWLTSLSVVAVLMASPARADSGPRLEGIDAEVSETELELETKLLDTDEGLETQFQLQAEHAISERWSLGGELEIESEPGRGLKPDAVLVKVKWRTPSNSAGMALALQAGAGYSFVDDVPLAEVQAFLGWRSADWSLVGRFRFEQALKRDAEPEFGYRVRAVHYIGKGIELGLEGRGDIWTGNPTEHLLGPLVNFPLGDDQAPKLEIGALAGLNRASPTMYYWIELELEF